MVRNIVNVEEILMKELGEFKLIISYLLKKHLEYEMFYYLKSLP
jgi:hypothetical protein